MIYRGHLKQAEPNLGASQGERLPNDPRFTAALNADYAFSSEGLKPTVGTTLRYVGEREASFDASTTYPQYRLPEYTTVDLRSSLMFGSVSTQFYVHNLSDERGQLSIIFPQFGARVALIQPRTFGVNLSMKF